MTIQLSLLELLSSRRENTCGSTGIEREGSTSTWTGGGGG